MQEIPFALAVFDEIQNLKNPETLAYQAARKFGPGSKLGLTGTPMENNLVELKSLFDLTAPGYLGSIRPSASAISNRLNGTCTAWREKAEPADFPFRAAPLEENRAGGTAGKDRRPAILPLSEDQSGSIGRPLPRGERGCWRALGKEDSVPYIHIFALLTLLKQICDHPALAGKDAEDLKNVQSGKWDLFQELLEEGLDSGQKIVVYSQFLGMIGMMERILQGSGCGLRGHDRVEPKAGRTDCPIQ